MTFKNIVEKLIKAGWTQQSLASKCGCGQSTLSDILAGKTKSPRWDLAAKLIKLSKNPDLSKEQEGA